MVSCIQYLGLVKLRHMIQTLIPFRKLTCYGIVLQSDLEEIALSDALDTPKVLIKWKPWFQRSQGSWHPLQAAAQKVVSFSKIYLYPQFSMVKVWIWLFRFNRVILGEMDHKKRKKKTWLTIKVTLNNDKIIYWFLSLCRCENSKSCKIISPVILLIFFLSMNYWYFCSS